MRRVLVLLVLAIIVVVYGEEICKPWPLTCATVKCAFPTCNNSQALEPRDKCKCCWHCVNLIGKIIL